MHCVHCTCRDLGNRSRLREPHLSPTRQRGILLVPKLLLGNASLRSSTSRIVKEAAKLCRWSVVRSVRVLEGVEAVREAELRRRAFPSWSLGTRVDVCGVAGAKARNHRDEPDGVSYINRCDLYIFMSKRMMRPEENPQMMKSHKGENMMR